jgi:hypothetical protein
MFSEFSIGTRILIFVLGMGLGFFFLLKPLFFVNILGKSNWAEAKIPGGTYGAIKLFGIFLMIISVIISISG